MPTTRKKIIKTVYKDEEDSDEAGDFSDSGSEAHISEESESSDPQEESGLVAFSGDEFSANNKRQATKRKTTKTKFAKSFLSKIKKQSLVANDEDVDVTPTTLFTVKDLTDADKLLPSILNLSESDSSDDEDISRIKRVDCLNVITTQVPSNDSDEEGKTEYKDVWSQNIQDDSEEIAKKTFMELEQQKAKIEETKASLQSYRGSLQSEGNESNVKDLLALGEDIPQKSPYQKKGKTKNIQENSESELEDWEEVKESKTIPQQGLQLFVEFPDAVRKKAKTIDVEMMMKRKINRVKKEYQIYMHKVHVLCWLGHGNYLGPILNDQELMAAALSLIPSKESYPGERVDMKYVEQITTWYKDKLTLKQDKNEDKFRPKALPLKEILLGQIKKRVVTTKKYMVFIFVAMLRALGLQCRIMFNFVTLPIKPSSTELCSLSMKQNPNNKENKSNLATFKEEIANKSKLKKRTCSKKASKKQIIPQVDGNYDCDMTYDTDFDDIMQLDGNDDTIPKSRSLRSTRLKKPATSDITNNEEVSPSKIQKKCSSIRAEYKNTKSLNTDANADGHIKSKSLRNTRSNQLKPTVTNSNKDLSYTEITSKNKESEVKIEQINKPDLKKISTRRISQKKPTDDNNLESRELIASQKPIIETKTKKFSSNKMVLEKINSAKGEHKNEIDESDFVDNNKKMTSQVGRNSQKNNVGKQKSQITMAVKKSKVVASEYFDGTAASSTTKLTRKRSQSSKEQNKKVYEELSTKSKNRTKSAPGIKVEKSKYFDSGDEFQVKRPRLRVNTKNKDSKEDEKRVSHRDLAKGKSKPQNDVTGDLMCIIKNRIKDAKVESRMKIVKGKAVDSDSDSDHLPEEVPKQKYESDDDFKPKKILPKPSTSKKIDRRVLSSDDEKPSNKVDVWCEVFVEELEQWVCIDIFRAKVHAKDAIYLHATHPVCYVVGWDNNNYLKDLTRRYVPHWNTVTRKQRVEHAWWEKAIKPWLGPKTARDREEDECLDRMQLEAPLPKSIAEYKNHPLYALKRHLLKFEAIYPENAATLGFVRGEPVYARDCVYVCRSRDTWLKEAKVVRLGETPYKVVKARPKWDKLSNKLITDKPLEVFGPWQVQDYEPPVAENGIVPRNAYGNVELFKECMLPKGTVHVKLPGLNKVAKKLNIDCAPAMTGFDFNGGWSHPVYDGFVVCKEFEEIIIEAWLKDQEEQERREREKIEARVYGNWRRLIKGLLIRERLKNKYGFEEPSTSKVDKGKSKAPKLVVKKR